MSIDKKFNITSQLRQHLLNQSELAEALDLKIFPMEAPQGTQGDFLVIERSGYERERVKQGNYEENVYIDLTLVSDHYDRGVRLAELIDTAMDSFNPNPYDVWGLQKAELVASEESFEDRKYYQFFRYKV